MTCVMMTKVPGVQKPWSECYSSAVSFCFDVHDGFKGCVSALKFPEGMCGTFEQYDFKCCDTRLEFLQVYDPECECCPDKCALTIDECCSKVYLPAGRYRMLIVDPEGNPYIPDEDEILVHVNHEIC